jgi:lysophospholipase L1-like esterase
VIASGGGIAPRFRNAPGRAGWWRRILAPLLLLVGALTVFAAVGELACRWAERRPAPERQAAFRKSAVEGLDYEFEPGARLPWAGREIRVNTLGFRGPEFSLRPAGRPRLVILGDSIAAGYGVAEDAALPAVLGKALDARSVSVEVLGLGVPGYNIAHIVALWNARGRSLEPRSVLYAACLNDALPELHLRGDGTLAAEAVELEPGRVTRGRVPLPGKLWLVQHSAFYRFLMARYDRALQRLGVRTPPLPPQDRMERLYTGSPLAERYRSHLAALARSVRTSGATLTLAVFPTADQVRTGRGGPQAALSDMAREAGIRFVDLMPALREAARSGDSLFLDDGLHPTARGHAVAAERLAAEIASAWAAAPTESAGDAPGR